MSITEQDLKNVYMYGQYSNPAWKRYNYETTVFCDRCRKANLKICIGYKQLDLCLDCVSEMQRVEERDKNINVPVPVAPIVIHDPYTPTTRMMQSQYRTLSKMMQSQYKSCNSYLCEESACVEKTDKK